MLQRLGQVLNEFYYKKETQQLRQVLACAANAEKIIKADAAKVRGLLKKKAAINAVDADKRTALHDAARRQDLEIVKLLLELNATPKEDKNGYSPLDDLLQRIPLHWAAEPTTILEKDPNTLAVAKLLIESKTSLNASNAYRMFVWATDHWGTDYVHRTLQLDVLLQAKASPNGHDINGDTWLHHAVKNGLVVMVESLLNAKANVFARNNKGETPRGTLLGYKGNSITQNTIEKIIKTHEDAIHRSRAVLTGFHAKAGQRSVIHHAINPARTKIADRNTFQLILSFAGTAKSIPVNKSTGQDKDPEPQIESLTCSNSR